MDGASASALVARHAVDNTVVCALSDARQLHCFGDNSFNQTTVPAAVRGAHSRHGGHGALYIILRRNRL